MRHFLVLLVAAFLVGCTGLNPTLPGASDGPGTGGCDVCDATRPFADSPAATVAAAEGGQRASNQPTQMDPARINPYTVVGRGSGATSSTTANRELRSQAGAPSVNQGLILPVDADAASGGGISPVVASLQALLDSENERLDLEADPEERRKIRESIAGLVTAMAQAQSTAQGVTHNTYNLQGARVVQSVANGSKSGDSPGGAIDPEGAAAVGAALGPVGAAAMEAESPPESPLPEPSPSSLPPVGGIGGAP